MTAPPVGTVVFGDVVDSRHDPGSTAWLRSLCADLEAAYPRNARLASFAFTQGDEIQCLIAPNANPFLGEKKEFYIARGQYPRRSARGPRSSRPGRRSDEQRRIATG